jgi:hypothetical protein
LIYFTEGIAAGHLHALLCANVDRRLLRVCFCMNSEPT